VGDLINGGPDSLGCLALIEEMVADGVAEAVLGNHELNLLHLHAGLRARTPQHLRQLEQVLGQLEQSDAWDGVHRFLSARPLHLLLDDGRLRVVHACWHESSIPMLPDSVSDPTLLQRTAEAGDLRSRIENCVKGPLEPGTSWTDPAGLTRSERRVRWWEAYPADAPFIAFGHYRFPWEAEGPTPRHPALLGPGQNAICLDYGLGWGGPLVALRYPEREILVIEP